MSAVGRALLLGALVFAGCTAFGSSTDSQGANDGGTSEGGTRSEGGLAQGGNGCPTCELVSQLPCDGFSIVVSATTLYAGCRFQSIWSLEKAKIGTGTFAKIGDASVQYMRLEGSTLFWAEETPPALVSSEPAPFAPKSKAFTGFKAALGMAVAPAVVFFTEQATNTVWRAPRSGGAAVQFATNVNGAEGLAYDAASNTLYMGANRDNFIFSKRLDATETVTFEGNINGPGGLAIDGGFLYWAEQYGGGAVYRKPLNGGQERELIAKFEAPEVLVDVAVDATHVYWTLQYAKQLWRRAK